MRWRNKLWVWTPQIVDTAGSIGCWMLLATGLSTPAAIGVGLTGGVLALVATITSITKWIGIDNHGWDRYLDACPECKKWEHHVGALNTHHKAQLAAVEAERDKLTQALLGA